jgi:hypothetical protein
VVDAFGTTSGLHRPGSRHFSSNDASDVLARDRHRRDLAQAYRDYDLAAENSWRNPPTGAGSSGPIGQREGDQCTKNGFAGVLRRGPDGFYCDIGNNEFDPDDLEDTEESAEAAVNNTSTHIKSTQQRMRGDAKRAAYDAYDAQLRDAWKRQD